MLHNWNGCPIENKKGWITWYNSYAIELDSGTTMSVVHNISCIDYLINTYNIAYSLFSSETK